MPIAVTIAFVVTVSCLAAGLRSSRLKRALADTPNERSLHQQVTPRIGGLGILAGVAAAIVFSRPDLPLLLGLLAYLVLATVSALDDRSSLSAGGRMLIHLLVAATWLVVGSDPPWSPWSLAPLILITVWSMNLFNFMDGADGLAGGMAAIGIATIGLVAAASDLPGAVDITLAAAVVAAAALGFLCFNFPPARLFLGDAGSIPLGFAAAAIGIQGARIGLWSGWFPVIVFFPFVFDASFTLAARALRGEKVWQAHREHLYQKVILRGLTHRQMTVRAYALMGLCATAGLASRYFTIWIQTLIIVVLVAAGLALAGRISRQFAQESSRS